MNIWNWLSTSWRSSGRFLRCLERRYLSLQSRRNSGSSSSSFRATHSRRLLFEPLEERRLLYGAALEEIALDGPTDVAEVGVNSSIVLAGPETDFISPYQRIEASDDTYFSGEYLVSLSSGVSSESIAADFGFVHEFSFSNLNENLNLWKTPEAVEPDRPLAGLLNQHANDHGSIAGSVADSLALAPGILDIYPVYHVPVTVQGLPNDPLLPAQWHLYNVGQTGGTPGLDSNVQGAWDLGTSGKGVTIGIVDDGVDIAHPDLNDHVIGLAGYNFSNNNDVVTPQATDNHGTPVAGIAAAEGNNGIGVSGVAPDANIGSIRLLGPLSTGLIFDDQAALALAPNTTVSGQYDASYVDVYNNSWGTDFQYILNTYDTLILASRPMTVAAMKSGTMTGRGGLGSVYVIAAGNDRSIDVDVNLDNFTSSRYAIGVAAVGHDATVSSYSTPGAALLVSAPSRQHSGSGEGTTTVDNRTGVGEAGAFSYTDYASTFGGTSSAAPFVSGVVADMLEANPNLSWRDVQHVLVRSAKADGLADSGFAWDLDDWTTNGAGRPVSHDYGFGLVDAKGAVNLASNWASVSPELLYDSGLLAVNATITTGAVGIDLTKSHTIAPSDSLKVEHVEVVFNATHTYRGDLDVTLTSPSGTVSKLARARKDSNNNYNTWTFTTTRSWDESSEGTWTLRVQDNVSGDGGQWNNWRMRVYGTSEAPGTSGPRVTGLTNVHGFVNGDAVSSFQVQFDEPIDPTSFTTADVDFQRIGGAPIAVTGVTAVAGMGNRVFDVAFASQSTKGNYRVNIGPNIMDAVGNSMNQDGDGNNGEVTQDRYTEFFTLGDQFIYSNTTSGAIPDNNATGVTRSVSLPAVNVADVNVLVNVTHDYPRHDLDLRLSAPGVSNTLILDNNTGSSAYGGGFSDMVLDDEASGGVPIGIADFTNSYTPTNSLSAFDGSRSAGN